MPIRHSLARAARKEVRLARNRWPARVRGRPGVRGMKRLPERGEDVVPWDIDSIQEHRLPGALGLHNCNPARIIPDIDVPSVPAVPCKDTVPVTPVRDDEDIRLVVTAASLAECGRRKPSRARIV